MSSFIKISYFTCNAVVRKCKTNFFVICSLYVYLRYSQWWLVIHFTDIWDQLQNYTILHIFIIATSSMMKYTSTYLSKIIWHQKWALMAATSGGSQKNNGNTLAKYILCYCWCVKTQRQIIAWRQNWPKNNRICTIMLKE